jgi:hypothetical protein
MARRRERVRPGGRVHQGIDLRFPLSVDASCRSQIRLS